MAVFNPQIQPTQDPNFTNVTKPVPAPKADISTGLTLATVGEGIEGAAKLADTTFKGVLKDTIQQGVDNLQGGYLDSLKTAWNAQRSGIPINPATLAPVDDQGSNGPPPPAQLQAGLAQAQKIGIAQIQKDHHHQHNNKQDKHKHRRKKKPKNRTQEKQMILSTPVLCTPWLRTLE